MACLEVKNLSKNFGGLAALNNVNFIVNQGEILGLIGPNGAGKTTLFNVLSGTFRPSSGHIIFEGKDISHLKPSQIAARGIVRTYQANILFPELTVTQNVLVGRNLQNKSGFLGFIFDTMSARQDVRDGDSEAAEVLDFCGLAAVKNELARNLPHGYQRMLAIAMALAAKPRLLLLDEPVTGMNAEEISKAIEVIRRLKATGMTVMLVEHTMRVVMGLCERIVVLRFGEKLAEGSPAEIQANQTVVDAYLGVD